MNDWFSYLLIGGAISVIVTCLVVDDEWFQGYAWSVLSTLPLGEWMTFDDIAKRVACPQYHLRRVLASCMDGKIVEYQKNSSFDQQTGKMVVRTSTDDSAFAYTEDYVFLLKARPSKRQRIARTLIPFEEFRDGPPLIL